MAYTDHLLRFRSMSTEDLQTKKTALEAQDTVYNQQAVGTKSMSRDLRRIDDQLNAIAFVLRERGSLVIIPAPCNVNIGIADFSQIK